MEYKNSVIIILALLLFSSAYALSDEAKLYAGQLLVANESIAKLQENGFSIVRYQDTLTLAQTFYSDQLKNELENRSTDYTAVKQKLKELRTIEENAYIVADELKALELTINQTTDINLNSTLAIYASAQEAFVAERYEESLKLVDDTYQEISKQEAATTRVLALYEAASRTVGNYLKTHWWQITMIVLSVLLLLIILYLPFMSFLTNSKIKKLELRAKSINKLIADSQTQFFERGRLSESTYHVRMKKYAELLRDINRQIPLLREELLLRKRMFFSLTKKERGTNYGKED